MTIAQIAAIISILLSFGVDSATANNVRDILTQKAPVVAQATQHRQQTPSPVTTNDVPPPKTEVKEHRIRYEIDVVVEGDKVYVTYTEDDVVFNVPILLTVSNGVDTERYRADSVNGRAVFTLARGPMPLRVTATVESNGVSRGVVIDPTAP